ncbi:hypothetical protein ACOKGD_02690 [Microbacterium phosphatis]|uniref:hypothetical protein n=1 Tax=Microbacterium phosphatis TaxID=3140248 RepID=UPI0031402316
MTDIADRPTLTTTAPPAIAEPTEHAPRCAASQLREEWDAAEARGYFAAAVTVLPHSEQARGILQHLEDLLDDAVADEGVESSAARRVLIADLTEYLEERRGRGRPTMARLNELRYKMSSIQAVVPEGDPAIERRRTEEVVLRGYDPAQRDGAIAELRLIVDLWDPHRAPDHLALSRALRLASLLRLRGTSRDIEEARRLTDTAIQWRSRVHGAEHPLTIAARLAAVRNVLEPLEARRDEGPLRAGAADAVALGSDMAASLYGTAARVLGEHHSISVGTLACVARAARLAERPADARLHAERALALTAGRDERADAGVPAILRFVIAESEVTAASSLLGRPDGLQRWMPRRDPRVGRAIVLLDEAKAAIGHRLSLAPWNARIDRLRAALH